MTSAAKVIPLHSAPESEAVLLDLILQGDVSVLDTASELLTPDDFSTRLSRAVFMSALSLQALGTSVSASSVIEDLRATGELEKVGGPDAVLDLVRGELGIDARHHANVIRERSTLRRLYQAASAIASDAQYPDGRDAAEILDLAERRIMDIAEHGSEDGLVSVKQAMPQFLAHLESDEPVGIPTGISQVDGMIGSLKPGVLHLVAARPSMGKSSFCLQLALNAAIDHGMQVAIFSVEMTLLENLQRMVALETLVDLSHIVNRRLTDLEIVQIVNNMGRLHAASSRIWIDDTARRAAEMRSRARRRKSRDGLDLIVIDHVHLMVADGENRIEQVSNISRDIKALAKELDVPLIAACQLSREPTKRADHRPQLSDLRDSGTLEQDADVVMMLHRPEYYLTPREAQTKGLVGAAELIINKQRNGPTGTIDLFFRKESVRFEDVPETSWTSGGR